MDKVVHFEIPAEDLSRAQEFYKGVFGWQINEVPEMHYYILTTVETDDQRMPKEVGAINGGMMKKDELTPYPIVVINVSSIEDSIKKVKGTGGKVIMATQRVGDMGLYAKVSDTEGNIIGIWQDLK